MLQHYINLVIHHYRSIILVGALTISVVLAGYIHFDNHSRLDQSYSEYSQPSDSSVEQHDVLAESDQTPSPQTDNPQTTADSPDSANQTQPSPSSHHQPAATPANPVNSTPGSPTPTSISTPTPTPLAYASFVRYVQMGEDVLRHQAILNGPPRGGGVRLLWSNAYTCTPVACEGYKDYYTNSTVININYATDFPELIQHIYRNGNQRFLFVMWDLADLSNLGQLDTDWSAIRGLYKCGYDPNPYICGTK